MNVTALSIAQRFIGLSETPGSGSTPQVLAMLRLDAKWVADDSTAWCAAFVGWVAWLLGLSRTKSLAARSWLKIGTPIPLASAEPGFDVVIFKRGSGPQPGPDVFDAPGHVAFFSRLVGGTHVEVVGGNQSDAVTRATFPVDDVLGVRRLS